jgi:hypothetical protein
MDSYPELVSTREAAEILGISMSRLYHLKDRYPHVKRGTEKQSTLRFYKKYLV